MKYTITELKKAMKSIRVDVDYYNHEPDRLMKVYVELTPYGFWTDAVDIYHTDNIGSRGYETRIGWGSGGTNATSKQEDNADNLAKALLLAKEIHNLLKQDKIEQVQKMVKKQGKVCK